MRRQFLLSVTLVLLVSGLCFLSGDILGYRTVAMILLMVASVLGMLFEIMPVLLASALSAFIWNFFFIPPTFTFHIGETEDLLMFLLYFLVAMLNAVLTFKIRKVEKRALEKEEREKTIKLYNTLLNSLTHELRTPIATILGAVDTLTESRDKLNAEQENHLLQAINSSGLRLNRQVENLLSMSRLESGMLKPNPDWCDLSELVNSIVQKMDHPRVKDVVVVASDKLPLVKIDHGLMEQIVHNILHNAMQYSTTEGKIRVALNYQNDAAELSITDDGPGFPEEEIEHVFEKFYRLPQTKTGGSGLGLSIVKGFVEAQKGTVTLRNTESCGANFQIVIPAEASFINQLNHE